MAQFSPHTLRSVLLDQRERDTVVAALRFWQRYALTDKIHDEVAVAEGGRIGCDAALLSFEIDALIEGRINV